MADWDKIASRGDVEDRRGTRGFRSFGGGLGIGGVVLVVALTYLSGGNIGDVLTQLGGQALVEPQQTVLEPVDGAYAVFASTVLGSANDLWRVEFEKQGKVYEAPKLVLFREVTQSTCGGADSASGPHYCPFDKTIYLDETFFEELVSRFGASGGDVAEAYVMAHEVGHHVQNELGLLGGVRDNEASVQVELQADCFAGMWANSIQKLGILEAGEIREAMDAAAAVGDDRIQKRSTGYVNPESWTHGSAKQRTDAFDRGFESGSFESCK